MHAAVPVVGEPGVDRFVRVLRWTYRREDETVSCRLALSADCSAYELKIAPSWNPAAAACELFDDAVSAFERQTSIERGLIKAGFALERFESSSEPR